MTFRLNSGRQDILSAVQDIDFDDLISGTATKVIELPNGAIVLGGVLAVQTPFNSGTSDTLAVLDHKGGALLAATSIAAAGITPLTPVSGGAKIHTDNEIRATWTSGGAVPTAGRVRLVVNYVVIDRAHHSHG